MSKKLMLEIVTPDRKVLSEEVDYVGAPGVMGEFGVLSGHIPFLSALGVGNLYYKSGGKSHYVFVSGGFAEVSGAHVTVLAEVADKATEIDVERVRKSRERAEARLAKTKDNVDYARARAALERALVRMRTVDHAKQAGAIH